MSVSNCSATSGDRDRPNWDYDRDVHGGVLAVYGPDAWGEPHQADAVTAISGLSISGCSAHGRQMKGGLLRFESGVVDAAGVDISGNTVTGAAASGGLLRGDGGHHTFSGISFTDNTVVMGSVKGGLVKFEDGPRESVLNTPHGRGGRKHFVGLVVSGNSVTGWAEAQFVGGVLVVKDHTAINITGARISAHASIAGDSLEGGFLGGVFYFEQGSAHLSDVRISSCSASAPQSWMKGGVAFFDGVAAELTEVSISRCNATGALVFGGVVYMGYGTLDLTGVSISHISATARPRSPSTAVARQRRLGFGGAGEEFDGGKISGGAVRLKLRGRNRLTRLHLANISATATYGVEGAGLRVGGVSEADIFALFYCSISHSVGASRNSLGGGLFVNRGQVILYNTSILGNAAVEEDGTGVTSAPTPAEVRGNAVYVDDGVTTYVLPAPPGRWVPASECSACPTHRFECGARPSMCLRPASVSACGESRFISS